MGKTLPLMGKTLPINKQNPADLKIRSTPVDLTTQLKLRHKTPSFIDRYFG
jgi:hypothetical protein